MLRKVKERLIVYWSKLYKLRRKLLVSLSILLSPVVLFSISFYCTKWYNEHEIVINMDNNILFFVMLSFMTIIVLINLWNNINQGRLLKDVHYLLNIFVELYLQDKKIDEEHMKEVKSFLEKHGG